MGLIQKLKSALGFDGAQSPEPGTTAPRDVNVTVEREPSSESEDAVKGTETAASEAATTEEPDVGDTGADEASEGDVPIEEAEPTVDEAAETGTTESETDAAAESADVAEDESSDAADEPAAESAAEPAEEPAAEATDVSSDPVTDISGIGPAYGERLADAGVETVADLADADPSELESATDISASRIEGWIDAAAEY